MPHSKGDRSALDRLHTLLDEMAALRIEYDANAEHRDAFATLGRTKALEVCTVLDKAIAGLKNIIGEYDGRPPAKDPDAPSA